MVNPYSMIFSPNSMISKLFHHSSSLTHALANSWLRHWFGKCISHLWGFIIFSKSNLWASMNCLLKNSILPLKDVLFMYTMLINNTWKYIWNILQSFFTSLMFSLIIPLFIFLAHACEKYLVARYLSYFSTWFQSFNLYMVS